MNQPRYPWETYVQDALTASRETSARRIQLAERAIAERLKHFHQPDTYEAAALICALETLNALDKVRTLTEAPMYPCSGIN